MQGAVTFWFQNTPNIVFSSEHSVLFVKASIIKITLPAIGQLQIWQYMVSDPIRLEAMMNMYNIHCIYMHIYIRDAFKNYLVDFVTIILPKKVIFTKVAFSSLSVQALPMPLTKS